MKTELTITTNPTPPVVVALRQADSDEQLIELWLHGRSEHTQRAYRGDIDRFLNFIGEPLGVITLGDVQSFADGLEEVRLQPSSCRRILSSVKSLFSFAHRIGHLPFDVAKPLRLRGMRESLSERILDEAEVQRMITLEPHTRNRAILTLLYAAGLRVSEICSLKWHNFQRRDDAGQINVFGKGDKTRTILLPSSVWILILSLRENKNDDEAVFRSRKGGKLSTGQVWRIVRKASQRAGIDKDVSCHWLRHAHASHALDRGAPISLVQATLGHASVATTGRYLHARPQDSSSKYLAL